MHGQNHQISDDITPCQWDLNLRLVPIFILRYYRSVSLQQTREMTKISGRQTQVAINDAGDNIDDDAKETQILTSEELVSGLVVSPQTPYKNL